MASSHKLGGTQPTKACGKERPKFYAPSFQRRCTISSAALSTSLIDAYLASAHFGPPALPFSYGIRRRIAVPGITIAEGVVRSQISYPHDISCMWYVTLSSKRPCKHSLSIFRTETGLPGDDSGSQVVMEGLLHINPNECTRERGGHKFR